MSKNFVIYAKKVFTTDDKNKVWDNWHFTGKYKGTIHNVCNLNYKTSKEILAVFHHDSTCDYHFIIKELAEEFKGKVELFSRKYRKIYNIFSTN